MVGSIESFKLMLMEELKERSTKGCVGEWRIEWTSPFNDRGEWHGPLPVSRISVAPIAGDCNAAGLGWERYEWAGNRQGQTGGNTTHTTTSDWPRLFVTRLSWHTTQHRRLSRGSVIWSPPPGPQAQFSPPAWWSLGMERVPSNSANEFNCLSVWKKESVGTNDH